MKTFAFLTYGFQNPTPEIMTSWNNWLESIKDNIVEQYGLTNGREISKDGTKKLPLDLASITGLMLVSARTLDDAEKMAQSNPYITSIRVYEIMHK